MARFQISDVKWDFTGGPTSGEETPEFLPPTDFILEGDDTDAMLFSNDDEEVTEALSDAISNKYGFCHFGFNWRRVL